MKIKMGPNLKHYDSWCVHDLPKGYNFAFNTRDFLENGGGRLELLKNHNYLGFVKLFIVDTDGTSISDDCDLAQIFRGSCLLQIYRAELSDEAQSKGHGLHLYEAVIEAAKLLGACGVCSDYELNEKSRRMWTEKLPRAFRNYSLREGPERNRIRGEIFYILDFHAAKCQVPTIEHEDGGNSNEMKDADIRRSKENRRASG